MRSSVSETTAQFHTETGAAQQIQDGGANLTPKWLEQRRYLGPFHEEETKDDHLQTNEC